MRKILGLVVLCVMCFGLIAANGNAEKMWITTNSCGDFSQKVTQYAINEKVYINGDGFTPSESYYWAITGGSGSSSQDPDVTLANGFHSSASGAFCIEQAYTIQTDDWGLYNVDYSNKHSPYHVNGPAANVPEFETLIGILTALSALGVFFVVRRK